MTYDTYDFMILFKRDIFNVFKCAGISSNVICNVSLSLKRFQEKDRKISGELIRAIRKIRH